MKKLIFLPILIFFLSFQSLSAQQKEEDTLKYIPVVKYDAARDSEKDLAEAVKEAKRENKKIFLDVGGEWCIWCRKFDQFLEENKDAANYLNKHFILVKINVDKEHKNEKFLSKFPKVEGYPHFFILNKAGKLLRSQNTGLLESGDHHDKDKVFAFLKKWAAK